MKFWAVCLFSGALSCAAGGRYRLARESRKPPSILPLAPPSVGAPDSLRFPLFCPDLRAGLPRQPVATFPPPTVSASAVRGLGPPEKPRSFHDPIAPKKNDMSWEMLEVSSKTLIRECKIRNNIRIRHSKLKTPRSKLRGIFPVRNDAILISLVNPATSRGECTRYAGSI